ncbi:hypothetical protein OS493_029623 [Desmophyllum pertusum]|uniref:CUB domain-containing protein n=1 Tax=Desmophyllum pertusum TaxID=174260 RepID=A0A9W9ZZ27_9CNID|nr:hypothetical protein OS493_029623 [Desmophyllum pertusum]
MNIVLRNASGVFQSPWYPHRYPYELINKCHWKIIAPKGKVVRIEFLSFRICDNYAQITDRINGLNSRIVKISVSSGTCILNESSTVHMAGEGRSFSTPGYPSHPGKGTCSWNITVSPGEFVKVTFWEMEGSSNQNYAEVYDVTNSRWKSLGTFARHSRVNEFYSIGNNVLVEFTSRYLAWPGWPGGFIASYEAVKAAPARYSCSKPTPNWWSKNVVTLHGYNGEFASFGYPLPYPNDVKCSWEIKAPLGYVIQLTFHSFHLQPDVVRLLG